jgi:polar amino acid transport system substrate-binding protein
VTGYVNTAEFDQAVADGRLKVSDVAEDRQNLFKLLAKRVDLTVIDKNVFRYIVQTQEKLKVNSEKLGFSKKLLENKNLYICFRKGDEGEKFRKLFNEGLLKIDVKKIMAEYFKKFTAE